jgi:hypothetical protein
VETALAAASRQPGELGVADACFCHGSGGVAHLLRALEDVTGDDRLAGPAASWTAHAFAQRVPGTGIGGFTTAAHMWDADGERLALGGLQIGAAGVGLALLASAGLARTRWDSVFLIPSVP